MQKLENRDNAKLSTKPALTSDGYFRNLSNNILTGIIEYSLQGNITYINLTLAKMFGFTSALQMQTEITATDWQDSGWLDSSELDSSWLDSGQYKKFMRELIRKGYVNNYKINALSRTGKTLNTLVSATLKDNLISCIVIDISKSGDSQKALHKNHLTIKPVTQQDMILVKSITPTNAENKIKATGYITPLTKEKISKMLSEHEHRYYKQRLHAENKILAPLLRTKLYRPVTNEHHITRPRLSKRLNTVQEKLLTLVSAPAGYGKSSLISHWLESNKTSSAWISLDIADSDLRQFLNYFIAALQCVFPNACSETLNLVNAPLLPPVQTLAIKLINEIDALGQHFILVLDDYHRISADSPVNELLQKLLTHPPRPLHLAIITRRDPPLDLLAFRVGGKISEIRTQDLRFNDMETQSLLRHALAYSVSANDIKNLQQEFEGWAVGLRLVSLAMQENHSADKCLQNMRDGVAQTQAYLVQEVLARQSPQMRNWLLKSAMLERFCRPLCEAICATDSNADEKQFDGNTFFDTVEASNLFTIALDSQGQWLRYHHLFQRLLQYELKKQLSAQEISTLHSRASVWFEAQNLIEEAIHHALQSKEVVNAEKILERHRKAEQDKEGWRSIERWLNLLPAEIRQQRAQLLLAQAWVLHNRHQMVEIVPIIQRLESLHKKSPLTRTSLGELKLFQGIISYRQGKAELSISLLTESLENVSSKHPEIIGVAEIYFSIASHMAGQGSAALNHLTNRISSRTLISAAFLSRLVLARALLLMLSSELLQVELDARLLAQLAKQNGTAHLTGWGNYLEASGNYRRNETGPALLHFNAAIEHRYTLHTRAAVDAMVGLALTHQAMNQAPAATQAIEQLLTFTYETNDAQLLIIARSGQARLALAQGDLESAKRWLKTFNEAPVIPSMFIWLEVPFVTQVRVLIASATENELQLASKLLDLLYQGVKKQHNIAQEIEILLLQAITLYKQSYENAAINVLKKALALASNGEWIQAFLEPGLPMAELLNKLAEQDKDNIYIDQILSAFNISETICPEKSCGKSCGKNLRKNTTLKVKKQHKNRMLKTPLTNRELDILELLHQRLRNKEIAARLFISDETVKSHIKHLYQKLGVSNRREAVLMAGEIYTG